MSQEQIQAVEEFFTPTLDDPETINELEALQELNSTERQFLDTHFLITSIK